LDKATETSTLETDDEQPSKPRLKKKKTFSDVEDDDSPTARPVKRMKETVRETSLSDEVLPPPGLMPQGIILVFPLHGLSPFINWNEMRVKSMLH